MADDPQLPREEANAETRLHSDIARLIDLKALELHLMRAVAVPIEKVGERIDALNDEVAASTIKHAGEHVNLETRWAGLAADIAYRKGLISWPRLALEQVRQYLPTILTLGSLLAIIVGFLTGNVSVGVGQ